MEPLELTTSMPSMKVSPAAMRNMATKAWAKLLNWSGAVCLKTVTPTIESAGRNAWATEIRAVAVGRKGPCSGNCNRNAIRGVDQV